MVSVASMTATLALALGVVSASAASLSSLPSFDLATIDYPTLLRDDAAPHRLLEALATDGIVALKNVPNYANLRERYLREAAQCAALQGDADRDEFVSRKLFADGTKRLTISTNAGRELQGSAAATDAKCPGFRALYEQFSQTVEHAVNTLGAALDQTSFTASDGHKTISSRQLVSEAVRLDHFHAYEAAAPTNVESETESETGRDTAARRHRQLELSLPLHEDHGLFIAMAAPKYFEVDETHVGGGGQRRQLVERELAADASGLIIQTAAGQRVRPVLHGDELVVMMGTGASRWLRTSHALPAVLHGMQMPEPLRASSRAGRRALRTWFGKMTLLPAYQRMLETSTPFEAHVNRTRRQLLTHEESELMTVGCATGRRLAPSDEKCTLKQCSLKAGVTAPEEPCSLICNRKGHSSNDAQECAAKCTCTDAAGPANICWMLCVANLPESSCALDAQKCSGQSIVCSASPTPTTTVPSPSTTRPAPAPGPAPGPAPTPAPGPAPAPGSSPSSTPAASTTSAPGTTPAPGSTTSSPTSASSSAASNGSTAGSAGSTSAEPQAGNATPKPTTAVPTPAPTTSSSAGLAISTLAGVAVAGLSAVLF